MRELYRFSQLSAKAKQIAVWGCQQYMCADGMIKLEDFPLHIAHLTCKLHNCDWRYTAEGVYVNRGREQIRRELQESLINRGYCE